MFEGGYCSMNTNYYNTKNSCTSKPCIPQETVIKNVRLARAYVPFQNYCSVYSPKEGLAKGTVFPELYQPYVFKGKNKTCMPMDMYKSSPMAMHKPKPTPTPIQPPICPSTPETTPVPLVPPVQPMYPICPPSFEIMPPSICPPTFQPKPPVVYPPIFQPGPPPICPSAPKPAPSPICPATFQPKSPAVYPPTTGAKSDCQSKHTPVKAPMPIPTPIPKPFPTRKEDDDDV